MAANYSFQNRFSYPQPSGVTPSIGVDALEDLTEEELEQVAPDLAEMAQMVREYSVLLSRTTTSDIFKIITRQADPQIAARLAAAKDRNTNTSLFSGLDAIQTIMFNDESRVTGTPSTYLNSRLFSDGMRRVSAALSAAILLARLPEVQREYAKQIRDDAYKDLELIVETYLLSPATAAANETKKPDNPVAFYFEPLDFDVPAGEVLCLEWYSPSFTTEWVAIQQYAGAVSTWNIVSDLADAINQYTSQDLDSALLAVAELGSVEHRGEGYHSLSFYPRFTIAGVIGHSINVRIQSRPVATPNKPDIVLGNTQNDPASSDYGLTPFKWGITLDGIRNFPVNGAIVVVSGARAATISPNQADTDYVPTVLWFRNKTRFTTTTDPDTSVVTVSPSDPPEDSLTFRYRLQPWQPNTSFQDNELETIEEQFERLYNYDSVIEQVELDNSRYSQIAVQLMNGMARINLKTRASGAVIRNDPTTVPTPMAALELVAWGISRSIHYIILDLLDIPKDIEVATGDLIAPRTNFSDKPRSVRVMVKNMYNLTGNLDLDAPRDDIKVVAKQQYQPWRDILDEAANVQQSFF
jgi:hypothetical protein